MNVDALVRHLAECPADFLAEPRIGKRDGVHVNAVIIDVFTTWGAESDAVSIANTFTSVRNGDRNYLRLVLIAAWVCSHASFSEATHAAVLRYLTRDLVELARLVDAERFVRDPDRREELVRGLIAAGEQTPEGESTAIAEDRLRAVSSVARAEVLERMRADEERVRVAMAKRRAEEEAAARYNGE